jgi:2,4-dienoyl-CoA reductase-like NADH-dependent reductase (Old Yellow Enzyme family)
VSRLFEPVTFLRGKAMKNRFMLAPLTNCQSHPDGRLSSAEQHWLTMRAQGGFGLVPTCAAHVQAIGQGFPGQLGIFGDQHVEGLAGLSRALHAEDTVTLVQLHHAGIRAPRELIKTTPVGPSDDAKTKARALTVEEIESLIEDFARAAQRAELAGFDGVEFLSKQYNRRGDEYGGSLDNRARILFSILDAVRARCRPDFIVGVRLSAERFGVELAEIRDLAQRLIDTTKVDFLDLSLWDCFKEPEEAAFKGRGLMSYFTNLDRKGVRLGVAGKLHDPRDAERVIDLGADFAILGRAAILHHDYPKRFASDPSFLAVQPPVTRAYLKQEGLSEPFIRYMQSWAGFVASPPSTDAAAQ